MTEQELAACYFMLYFGNTLAALLLATCVMVVIDAHIFNAVVIGISWSIGVVFMFYKMGLA